MTIDRGFRDRAGSALSWMAVAGAAILIGGLLAFIMYRQGVGAEEREHQQTEIAALQGAIDEANERLSDAGETPVEVPEPEEPQLVAGPAGAMGLQGPRGFPGLNGEDGKDGQDGVDGENGLDGADAATGATGATGAQGEPGKPGEPGPEGPAGPAGQDGTDGSDGMDGRSAYDIAVENGFNGSEQKWLDSLQGDTGPAGPTCEGAEKLETIEVYVRPDGSGERWKEIQVCTP